jgi:2-keto-4-pentenoate hydratase/2-oxohepta-3-ene-1,7-dioic acid hydratase in catechol pathway
MVLGALLALTFVALRSSGITGRLGVDNPRFESGLHYPASLDDPSVLRFVSALDNHLDRPCFGLVVEAADGIPREVLNLTAMRPELGSTLSEFLAHDGFAFADEAFVDLDGRPAALIERIDESELAERILPPVDVSQADLDREDRLIVGVGANYYAHQKEIAISENDCFAFAKPIEPRGAYGPLVPSGRGHPDAGKLLDYEVEIGFVLLEEIDLHALPPSEELLHKMALFVANDVSDRLPQILFGSEGCTRAKTHPGYLSIGPWMVHGSHLDLEGAGIEMHLRVFEDTPHPGGTARQNASSLDLIRGPSALLAWLAEVHHEMVQQDNQGVARAVARVRDGRVTLPAGTIVLTGTPHGVAIEAPGTWDRLRALARGNLSMSGARLRFARHCIEHREEMGYLSAGDTVESWVEHLGHQRWQVVDGLGL